MRAKDVCAKVKVNKKITFNWTIQKIIDRVIEKGGSCTFDRQFPTATRTLTIYSDYIDLDTSHIKKLISLGFKVEASFRKICTGTERALKKPEIYRFFRDSIPAEYETVNTYETIATTIISACCRED